MLRLTGKLLRKHGWRLDRAAHNYIYFVYYYPYVRTLYHLLRVLAARFAWLRPLRTIIRMAFDRYHAKFLSGSDARKILTLDEDVRIVGERNRDIVPYRYAHSVIFNNPGYIAVMDCPCKKTLGATVDTLSSCICVGETTARFWVERLGKKYNARRISREEALSIVNRFRGMGYVTQAFFKVATGGSTGVICNCHPDTCVSLKATVFARRFDPGLSMAADAGYAVHRDSARCKHCGACAAVCHFGAIRFVDGEWSLDRERCAGCGLCEEHCTGNAISLIIDPGKPLPLDIDLIRGRQAG
ncbi:MAG: 4Fe-4S binding protein [Spirochaetes bacterium]|jgi:ferredoxin|nr:4Fe-4S binding protein [Spirochaetota bacterium]